MHFDEKLCLIIFFNLETTGFNFESCHDGVQIYQIAASTYNEDNARNELKFEKYLKPTVPFQIGALKVNGLFMEGFNVILRGKIVKQNGCGERWRRDQTSGKQGEIVFYFTMLSSK